MTQRQKTPQLAWHFLHQLTYISSRLVWKKSLIWSLNNSKHNSKTQREVKSLEANQTTIWAFDFESLCLINGWEVKNVLINIKMWEAKYTACHHCAYIRFIHLKNTKLPIWQNMPCPPNLCLFLLCLQTNIFYFDQIVNETDLKIWSKEQQYVFFYFYEAVLSFINNNSMPF